MTTVELSLSEAQLSPTIEKCLENIIKKEGFIKHKKYERAISTNGGNYLGDLFEVDIKGKTIDGNKETNLFIKRIIVANGLTFVSTADIQNREILAYRELSALGTQLMDEAGVPRSARFKQAKCYDANSEALIFENLAAKGYTTMNRTSPLTFEFAELAIKQLAKFHALSFVIQKKYANFFNTNLKHLKYPAEFNSDFQKFIRESFDICCELLDETASKRLGAAFNDITNVDKHYGEQTYRCLCHGDYRSNNMLVKEQGGKVVDIVPVDFQIIHYGNPMNDFWYLLIAHSDHEFRRKHLTTLKELYYDTLTQFLKYFKIDASSVYSRELFESDYKERLIYGLYSSMFLLSFLFAEESNVPDLNDIKSLKSTVTFQDGAKKRIQDIVDDYIEWGII